MLSSYPLNCVKSLAVALTVVGSSIINIAHANDQQLTVYTYDSFVTEWGPGPIIKKGFEAQCNCTLNFVAIDSSAGILNRIQLEGNSSKADVVIGLDTNLMAIAEDSGLIADSGIDMSAIKLPINWDSTKFVPYDYGHFAFVYDTEALDNPPSSMAELIDAPDSMKIIIQDPRTSTPGLGLMLWMKSIYGDDAHAMWKKLQSKILTVTPGWSEAYFSLFLNGEAPLVLSYETSPGYHMAIDKTERYQAAAFEEGHYLQVELAAMLKNTKEPELAKAFLSYLIGVDAQSALPLTNVMYPSTDIGAALPAEFSKLITPAKSLMFSPEQVRDNRKQWVDEWLDASQ